MPQRLRSAALVASLLALAFAAPAALVPAGEAGPPEMKGYTVDDAWPEITFSQPVLVTHAKDGSGNVYVAERPGRIMRLPKWDRKASSVRPTVFLDIRTRVTGVTNAQGGLLGVAFHPQYRSNKRFFVSYLAANTQPRDPANKFIFVVEEYRSDGSKAIPRGRPLLGIRKSTGLHNAGGIAFGPDGKLYIGVGDNIDKPGSGAAHVSQNVRSPLGKILRIDVDAKPAPGKQYAVPADNPWPNTPRQVLPEIWAYGVRNPWRFSWDAQGRMFVVEPGTSARQPAPPGTRTQEWVQQIVRGQNHGWPYFEGKRQLVPLPPNIRRNQLVPKAFAYEREGTESTAGVGGYFYRGTRHPQLRGKYIFADYGRGAVYVLDIVGSGMNARGTNFRLLTELPSIGSLGEDEDGDIYICSTEDDGWVAMLMPDA
ncbi:MAG: PQQ-dependent sugar dehydrogenase [Planctomycetota bacterium]|nr:PQQ-dependent sugar dehydrogenase [Planctomycetota bacterium]